MKIHTLITCFAVLVAAGGNLSAQDAKWTFGFKSGGGAVIASPGDQSRITLNLGATGEFRLAEKTSVFAELKYRTFRSVYKEVTRFGDGYTPTGVLVPNGITRLNSVDVRRNPVHGYGLAIGYRAPLAGDYSWQAGLSLDYFKSTQEVTGVIAVGSVVATREGLSHSPREMGMKPGAFAGVQWAVSSSFYIESNLVYVSFNQINYLPRSYSGRPATTETKSVSKVLLEINAGFRF